MASPWLAAAAAAKAYIRLQPHFADTVDHLDEGSVVYQDLDVAVPGLGGVLEHSGIYVGGYKIVSLSHTGEIVEETTREFLESEGAWNRFVWVSCIGSAAVGKSLVAERAREMVGGTRKYNFAFDNCHQFTSGCLTGDFENTDNLFILLEETVRRKLRFDNWRVWDRDQAIQKMCDRAIREIAHDRRQLEELINADFDKRKKLLGASFDRLQESRAIKDVDGFLDGLAEIAKAHGGELPWLNFESFDDWMGDDDTVLKM